MYETSQTHFYLRSDLYEVFVTPLYMRFLHGNPFRRGELDAELDFFLRRALLSLDRRVLLDLLGIGEWRAALMSGFFVAALPDQSLEPILVTRLNDQQSTYAIRGISFGLAALGTPTTGTHLAGVLHEWLAKPDHYESLAWVFASLQLLDRKWDTALSAEFLDENGPWAAALETLRVHDSISKALQQQERLLTLFTSLTTQDQSDPPHSVYGAIARIPLRKKPSAVVDLLMRLQCQLVRILYRAGITGTSPYFPWVRHILAVWPYSYYAGTNLEWRRKFGLGPKVKMF